MANTEKTKEKIKKVKEEIEIVEQTLVDKQSELEQVIEFEKAAQTAAMKPQMIDWAKEFVKSDKEMYNMKKEAVESIRTVIREYLNKSQMLQSKLNQTQNFLAENRHLYQEDMFKKEDRDNISFVLDKRHEHKKSMTLKALVAAVFTNEGEKETFVMRDLNGLSFLENYNRNKWIKEHIVFSLYDQ